MANIAGNRIFQIFYCVLFGAGAVVTAFFMFAVVFGLFGVFKVENAYVSWAAIVSVCFYFSWLMGCSSAGFESLSHFTRGFLSTSVFNGGLIWYAKHVYGVVRFPYALALILLLNFLFAVYGSQTCERLIHLSEKEGGGKKSLMGLAVTMPISIVALGWFVFLAVISGPSHGMSVAVFIIVCILVAVPVISHFEHRNLVRTLFRIQASRASCTKAAYVRYFVDKGYKEQIVLEFYHRISRHVNAGGFLLHPEDDLIGLYKIDLEDLEDILADIIKKFHLAMPDKTKTERNLKEFESKPKTLEFCLGLLKDSRDI